VYFSFPPFILCKSDDFYGRITVFQVGYPTNMRFRWIMLRRQYSTTMIYFLRNQKEHDSNLGL